MFSDSLSIRIEIFMSLIKIIIYALVILLGLLFLGRFFG